MTPNDLLKEEGVFKVKLILPQFYRIGGPSCGV